MGSRSNEWPSLIPRSSLERYSYAFTERASLDETEHRRYICRAGIEEPIYKGIRAYSVTLVLTSTTRSRCTRLTEEWRLVRCLVVSSGADHCSRSTFRESRFSYRCRRSGMYLLKARNTLSIPLELAQNLYSDVLWRR